MMNKIKKGFSILPYCYQIKLNISLSFLFLALGILLSFFEESFQQGIIFIVLISMMVMQMIKPLEVSSLVATSPKRSFFLATFPNMFCIVFHCFSYILSIVLLSIQYKREMYSLEEFAGQIIYIAAFIALINIYTGIVYKKFLLSIVLYTVGLFALITTQDMIIYKFHSFAGLTKESSILIGFAIILFGNLIGQFLQYITRKLPFNRLSVGASLRKYM